jgi:hypothetical protein
MRNYPSICLENLRKTTNPQSRYPVSVPRFEYGPPEYEAAMLTTQPWQSAFIGISSEDVKLKLTQDTLLAKFCDQFSLQNTRLLDRLNRSSSSSSLARQPYVGPGLPQKLLPAFLFDCYVPQILHSQNLNILDHSIFPYQLRPSNFSYSCWLGVKYFLKCLLLSILITCPAQPNLFILLYFTMSGSLNNSYSSFWRVLTMVWCISKYLAFGLYPSSNAFPFKTTFLFPSSGKRGGRGGTYSVGSLRKR